MVLRSVVCVKANNDNMIFCGIRVTDEADGDRAVHMVFDNKI